ncbi:MAG: tetratricopeptide repeat protein, partial [Calditrichia bacterium]
MKLNHLSNIIVVVTFISTSIIAQPENASTEKLIKLADSLTAIQDYKAAKKLYKKALKTDKTSRRLLSALGLIAFEEEDWGKVKEYFNKILQTHPDDLEAHYYLGIAYRETGKFKAFLLRKLDWNKSKKHFQQIISQDSLYRDVLYQFARLKRYRGKYEEAVQLGHAEVRLRPDLVEPQVKLFRLYRYLITHRSEDKALKWLYTQPRDYAVYFAGEKLRREGETEKADSIFQSLLNKPLKMPP